MNWKLVSAFAMGTVLASVIVYFAVRPLANVDEPRHVASVEHVAPVQRAAPIPAPAPAPKATPPVLAKHIHPQMPIREKPSPFRPRVTRDRPVAIAKYVPPPIAVPAAPPVVAPAPAPSVPVAKVSLPPPKPEPRVAPSVTLTAGTLLPVRISQALSSAHNQPGDTFFASLTQPLVVDGWVIAERGARVEGRVVDKAAAQIRISIVGVATSDGQNVRVHTEPYIKVAPAEVPVEARISFKVLDSITITERVD